MGISEFFWWFAGGSTPYHNLFHCMNNDRMWVAITVGLDITVACGYVLIAFHWGQNEKRLPKESRARKALADMRNIFVFCGICGYIFIPIKMFWPAWRLYDIVMAFLVYFTWKYAWGARELKVVYNELGRSEKLAHDLEESQAESRRKSFFLNAVSHDLRTPLNGLILQTSLAEMSLETDDAETLRQSLAEIKASARATSELLNGFLELGRLDWSQDDNQIAEFPLDELLNPVVNISQAPAEAAGLYLRTRAPRGVQLRSDRVKIERVLLNLVSNGLKFCRQGGVEIDVEVKPTLLSYADGSRGGEGSAGDVLIHVTDTGVGITPENQKLLFQEFFQVNNHERDRRKGFGLGLAIARRLAEQLGGSLAVESEVGHGSRFTVRLPGVVVPSDAPAAVDADAIPAGQIAYAR